MNITVEGKCHLGTVLGSRCFIEAYVSEKVESWSYCVGLLSDIEKVHLHAAYVAFVHGVCSKWTYFVCTIPLISALLGPLEDVISLMVHTAQMQCCLVRVRAIKKLTN